MSYMSYIGYMGKLELFLVLCILSLHDTLLLIKKKCSTFKLTHVTHVTNETHVTVYFGG